MSSTTSRAQIDRNALSSQSYCPATVTSKQLRRASHSWASHSYGPHFP